VMLGVTAGFPTLKRRLSDMVRCDRTPMWRVSRPVLAGVIAMGLAAALPWRITHQDIYALSTHYILEDLQIDPILPDPAENEVRPVLDSEATAINDRGQIAGTLWRSEGRQRAFLWEQGRGKQEIGSLEAGGDSAATAINRWGQIVGQASERRGKRAFL